jgi:uncharacterized protein (DUF427 family)
MGLRLASLGAVKPPPLLRVTTAAGGYREPMSLTLGNGPLTKSARSCWNVDLSEAPGHLLYLHDVPKRVRGVLAGVTVVDTRRARLLHETGLLPQWYLPLADVREDLLEPSPTSTHCPFKGDASYWSLRVGERREQDAVWTYADPLPSAPPLAGLVGIPYDRLDAWFEEDEELLGHPRDPFHRVDTRRSARHVVVRVAGEVVAETSRPVMLFETGLPARYYLPVDALREGHLEMSETTSVCPYKGIAQYRHVQVGDTRVEDAAWCYSEPLGEALHVAGYFSFLGDGVELEVDGEPV